MTETPNEALLRKAEAMAYGLGITVYVRDDGLVYQAGPGRAVEPPPGAVPTPAGRGSMEGASA